MRTLGEPQTASSRLKLVMFVPPANVLVKGAAAVQLGDAKSHLNSGMALQPSVPVDVTTTFWPTVMWTIRTVGGDGGVTIARVPLMPP